MSVTVLLFASYADALGGPSVVVDVPADATTDDVLRAVLALPGAAQLPKRPLVAVNHRYARGTTRLNAGDEIALIPPVAGG
jgi:molybdopterin converting factor subunit 1